VRYIPETTIDFDPGPSAEGSTDLVDPVIGLRALFHVRPSLRFTVSGDVGGFGIGSEFSWQAFARHGS
jgi:hypothetical protein